MALGGTVDVRRKPVRKAFLVALITLSTASVSAKVVSLGKITAPDWTESLFFGESVSISGDVCIVKEEDHPDTQKTYIFRYKDSNWDLEAELLGGDEDFLDYYGQSVSIDGDVCIIGTSEESLGSVLIYRYNGNAEDPNWIFEAKLLASDGSTGDCFGASVCIKDDVCVVGAPGYSQDYGVAYIFRFDDPNWAEEAKLMIPDSVEHGQFGRAVAIDDNVSVVGRANFNLSEKGSAHVFRYTEPNWIEEATLIGSDLPVADLFGFSVSLDGDVCVVGAPEDVFDDLRLGGAYVFRYNEPNWVQEAQLRRLNREDCTWFGESVSISGDFCVVGAGGEEVADDLSGAGYLFEYDGVDWILKEILHPTETEWLHFFGSSVSIDSDAFIIGAQMADYEAGAAYTYAVCPEGDLNGDCFVDLGDLAALTERWLTGPDL